MTQPYKLNINEIKYIIKPRHKTYVKNIFKIQTHLAKIDK